VTFVNGKNKAKVEEIIEFMRSKIRLAEKQ